MARYLPPTRKAASRLSEAGGRAAEQRLVERPLDADVGVVPGYAGLGRRVIGTGEQVGDVGFLAEHGEAVAEAGRDKELAVARQCRRLRRRRHQLVANLTTTATKIRIGRS